MMNIRCSVLIRLMVFVLKHLELQICGICDA